MTILEAMHDPALFGLWFKDRASWRAWEAFLAALFGLPMDADALAIYQRCTGRSRPPTQPATEAWMVVGRRGGKSRVAALIALFLATFRNYREYLAPGEVGMLPVIAAGRKQARTVMRYMTGLINAVPMLHQMLASEPTKEAIELTNRVTVEVLTASVAAVRNYTMVSAVCDEIAFWPTDEDGANPDVEILNALRPCMGTIPDSILIALSSPYARRGTVWEAHREHFGRDDDETLVWQAETATMHPHAPDSRLGRLIAKAYRDDEARAAAEYGAQFRRDIESFVAREVVEACVASDRHELPPVRGVEYVAFVDPSGGSQDSMTLAIAHEREDGKAVLDCIRERRPPFNPDDVVSEFAAVLKGYGLARVVGDRYGGEWPRERFRAHGIWYDVAEKPKSDLYRELIPVLNRRQVELLDSPRLINQLCSLERRVARSGKDSIDHAPGAHEDVANSVAGACLLAAPRAATMELLSDTEEDERARRHPFDRLGDGDRQQLEAALPWSIVQQPSLDLTCGNCVCRESRDGRSYCVAQGLWVKDKLPACELHQVAPA
ncbi:MAG: hypothetical protein ABSA52_23325 [Candidatus Binatia bacterium]|jgi:hypothetical protein